MNDAYSTRPNTVGQRIIWPLLGLILAAIAIGLIYRANQNRSEQTNIGPENTSVQNETAQQPAASNAGQRTSLQNITIAKAVSDRIFTVKSGSNTLYIILSPSVNIPDQTVLKEGQQVAIKGTLLSTNNDQLTNLKLTEQEKQSISGQQLVLLVDEINFTNQTQAQPNEQTQNNTSQ